LVDELCAMLPVPSDEDDDWWWQLYSTCVNTPGCSSSNF